MNDSPTRIPISDAADRLGVSVDTIRRGIKRGRWRAIRDNSGRWLVEIGPQDAYAPAQAAHAALPTPAAYAPTQALPASTTEIDGVVATLNTTLQRLGDMLDRERGDRLELQRQADNLRDRVNDLTGQVAHAEGAAAIAEARKADLEKRVVELQQQLDEARRPRPRGWWPFGGNR